MPPIRVLVIDDHDLFAESLRLSLRTDGYVCERAEATPPAIEHAVEVFQPDIVLLDLELGGGVVGTELIGPIIEAGASVVMVTAVEDQARMAECLEAGALSVINKSEPLETLVRAVGEAFAGRSINAPQRRAELLDILRRHRSDEATLNKPFERLTPAECEVLECLVEGMSADEIANRRVVSVKTVRSQIEAILAKLDVHSQLGAVALANRAGWTARRAAHS